MAYTDIDKPSDYFETVLYTGNGSTQSITGVGFQPDWVWVKGRSVAAGGNLSDSVRGVNKQLQSASNAAEESLTTCVTAFNSDGFSLGSNGNVNTNSATFVAWNWKASGSTASNTNGTNITSTVDANTTAGFSIVSYTGSGTTSDTVGHGLSSLDLLIVKSRDEADSWFVKHKNLASNKNLNLDQTVAETDVTSSYSEGGLANLSGNTFGFLDGTSDANSVNESGEKHIAYCFKSVQGYSKFGSYTGNGNANGTFVYTGFKPAFVMAKKSSSSANWIMRDNRRIGYNTLNYPLFPNSSAGEYTSGGYDFDFLSNGFKPRRGDSGEDNTSGSTYIYMAFAEQPFVTSTGVPTTAR